MQTKHLNRYNQFQSYAPQDKNTVLQTKRIKLSLIRLKGRNGNQRKVRNPQTASGFPKIRGTISENLLQISW